MDRNRWTWLATFGYVWLMVGFFTGTLVLLGPTKWITARFRGAGADQGAENLAMYGVMAAFVILSFLLSLWLTRRILGSDRRAVRFGVPATATALAALALWGWTNPARFVSAEEAQHGEVAFESGATFHFGPYPDRARLESLKAEGFAAVISLQHPAVVPFEPPGIKAEQETAADLGLPFIHAPMVPWVSDNAGSLNKIREIARTGDGKYYVHCGLGRDRTNVVKRMLERMGAKTGDGEIPAPRTFAARLADKKPPFERGQIREIEPDVWLIPYPNEHELYANMLSGQVAHVLLLLDPNDPQQAEWLAEARREFDSYAVPYTEMPLRPDDSDARAAEVAAKAKSLPRMTTIIVPFTRPKEDIDVAVKFMRAYGVDPTDYPPPNPPKSEHADTEG